MNRFEISPLIDIGMSRCQSTRPSHIGLIQFLPGNMVRIRLMQSEVG